ncbi:Uncharacterised protein [Salmonella enterica subsp. enterica serovar Bovismorbificans]|uniref:Uncharacterized protein n=1 Tax=Salmonella enterica subsp. enterica serovar Bovismorbificans TaxID=58097 RepID=A0A655D0U0_SALET|nr:Uncharacterised protein [Salmonella enterica subsp. enterica serovar Bovismorbificans]
MLIQLPVYRHHVLLLMLDLHQHIFQRRLRLPLPVESRHAACQQLSGLLLLRFARFDRPDPRGNFSAVFPP